MLKFPPHPVKNQDMSYSNSCISEYLGCKIFEKAGVDVNRERKYLSFGVPG